MDYLRFLHVWTGKHHLHGPGGYSYLPFSDFDSFYQVEESLDNDFIFTGDFFGLGIRSNIMVQYRVCFIMIKRSL